MYLNQARIVHFQAQKTIYQYFLHTKWHFFMFRIKKIAVSDNFNEFCGFKIHLYAIITFQSN